MKRAEKKRQMIEDRLAERRSKRRRDDNEFKVIEGVIDPPTLKILYRFFNRGLLTAVHGVINTGKEANVYHGETPDGRLVAVKIYRISTAETDFMREYMIGDPRFKRVGKKSRVLVPQWAMKEYKNLIRYNQSGVRVPEPIAINRNVMIMEFIGNQETGVAAPLLKNADIPNPAQTYQDIMGMIRDGFIKAKLVHADLSEYNILWQGEPVFIDVSQSVVRDHEMATKYLYRDIQNITRFFGRMGVDTSDPQETTARIIELGENE